ncbi:MAG: DUF2924 domain-containing protein [Alphaproteobacteria bacterium]|nr:DUF2924 domain-containing protein [Alphaproteobacteria bacterium]
MVRDRDRPARQRLAAGGPSTGYRSTSGRSGRPAPPEYDRCHRNAGRRNWHRRAAITDMKIRDFRTEWQRYYRTEPPPRLSGDLLTRGIAWKIQEAAHGGLSKMTRRRLHSLANQLAAGRSVHAPTDLADTAGVMTEVAA